MKQIYTTCFGTVSLDSSIVEAICALHPYCVDRYAMVRYVQGDIRKKLQNDSRSKDLALFAATVQTSADAWKQYSDIIDAKAADYQKLVDTTAVYSEDT